MTLPSKERLEYLKLLIETFVLLCILPFTIWALVTDPEHALQRVKVV